MKKGDIVRIKAYVECRYEGSLKIVHMPVATEEQKEKMQVRALAKFKGSGLGNGILLGKSWLATGIYRGGYEYDDGGWDGPYLKEDKRHPVWVVEPFAEEDKYYKPIRCLEEDLELAGSLPEDALELEVGQSGPVW